MHLMAAEAHPARNTAHSQSLERGLAILSAFRSGRPLLGVSDLSREVGLSRSTTHRYIATLAGLGYLEHDPPTRKYRLGPRVLDLGFSAINSMDLRELAARHRPQPAHRLAPPGVLHVDGQGAARAPGARRAACRPPPGALRPARPEH